MKAHNGLQELEVTMKVLLLSAELAPLAKAGGLADVAGSLPLALKNNGVDVRVMMPAYPMVKSALGSDCMSQIASIPSAATGYSPANVLSSAFGNSHCQVPLYLVEDAAGSRSRKPFFSAATTSSSIYTYEPEPYLFFARAALAWLTKYTYGWIPDIVHCNDWHTAMLPLLLKEYAAQHPRWQRPASLFTIHNLAYQGDFPKAKFSTTGLSEDYYGIDGVEFYGKWTFMKAALNFADHVNTVSPTYAREIQTPEQGCGLDGLMRKLNVHSLLRGILNGIDMEAFDPERDPAIAAPYSAARPAGKLVCREALQRELSLRTSSGQIIIGMVTRFAEQKGFDLITAIAEEIMQLPVQLAILGQGEPAYEKQLMDLQLRYPDRVSVTIGYNAELAQRVYAGSDLFLMPSRFEPCGLGQLIAMRYGTIPLVRNTGGLADTVKDLTQDPVSGTGFVFNDYTAEALLKCIQRAVMEISSPAVRTELASRAMRQDFGWSKSARDYMELYQSIQNRMQNEN